eukprot:9486686-Pyramimonas_sp.AAC.1
MQYFIHDKSTHSRSRSPRTPCKRIPGLVVQGRKSGRTPSSFRRSRACVCQLIFLGFICRLASHSSWS